MPPDVVNTNLHFCLLDEPLIRWRCRAKGDTHRASLPALFAAMAANELRDFPALRPHQRHPWHAFLTQLAAIALHRAGETEPWASPAEWRAALLALTPDDADGAAWCLVSPPDRPALLQAAVPGERVDDWKSVAHAADELDMLVTSKNHDLKGARLQRGEPDDWLFALVSLQTQEGYIGAGNYGISRMNSGSGSRLGVGVAVPGSWPERWISDVGALLARQDTLVQLYGFRQDAGHALLWLIPWAGADALSMSSLDPFYIEICRRIRLAHVDSKIVGIATTSSSARIASEGRKGMTGDAWTPVDAAKGQALTVVRASFDYRLIAELLYGSKYAPGAAQDLSLWSAGPALELIVQVTTRGQSKTEGYHERRVPISPALRRLLLGPQRASVAQIAKQRIDAIAALRKLLWSALVMLFANGDSDDRNDSISDKAGRFARPFEQREDARFFLDLSEEVEAGDEQRAERRVQWLLGLVTRAEAVLRDAFDAGPRNGMQRYKARAGAISRFQSGLRGPKPALPDLTHHYWQQAAAKEAAKEASNHV